MPLNMALREDLLSDTPEDRSRKPKSSGGGPQREGRGEGSLGAPARPGAHSWDSAAIWLLTRAEEFKEAPAKNSGPAKKMQCHYF